MGLPAPCCNYFLQPQLRPQPENSAVKNRGLRRAQVDRYIPETIWGIYLVLTSIYCLLAFLPYTYFALIKAPAYSWMPWFARHHRPLYWLVLLAAAVASRIGKKTRADAWLFGALAFAGIYLAARPFMPTLQNNWAAYWWSLIALPPAGDDGSVGPAPALAGARTTSTKISPSWSIRTEFWWQSRWP